MTADRVVDWKVLPVASRPAEYEPRAVLALVMLRLASERVPLDVKSGGRALEAAGRLLEALGVEPVDGVVLPANVIPFVPRPRPAVDA